MGRTGRMFSCNWFADGSGASGFWWARFTNYRQVGKKKKKKKLPNCGGGAPGFSDLGGPAAGPTRPSSCCHKTPVIRLKGGGAREETMAFNNIVQGEIGGGNAPAGQIPGGYKVYKSPARTFPVTVDKIHFESGPKGPVYIEGEWGGTSWVGKTFDNPGPGKKWGAKLQAFFPPGQAGGGAPKKHGKSPAANFLFPRGMQYCRSGAKTGSRKKKWSRRAVQCSQS